MKATRWTRLKCWLFGHRNTSVGVAWCAIETTCLRCGHFERKFYL